MASSIATNSSSHCHNRDSPDNVGDSISNGGSSDVPEHIELSIILPDGRTDTVIVDLNKQMMDLLVLVAVSNKLSPSGFVLNALNEDGQSVPYQASQPIGSLGITKLQLISKKTGKDSKKNVINAQAQPFQPTQRLVVNLPRNQKFVMRVNYKNSLADVFQLVCKEKKLDPNKYELCHPVHVDQVLDMTALLQDYGIHEIFVVSIPDQNIRRPQNPLLHEHKDNNISQTNLNSSWTRPDGDVNTLYMPGMSSQKKKRGILGLFSKRKEGKFKLSAENTVSTKEAPSCTSNASFGYKNSVVTHHAVTLENSYNIPEPLAGTTTLQQPRKPPRTKRKAPAPPAPVQGKPPPESIVSVSVLSSEQSHSRHSSHSSGFDEANLSVFETPRNALHEPKTQENNKIKTSIDASSIESTDMVAYSSPKHDLSPYIPEVNACGKQKKRKAPVPPILAGNVDRLQITDYLKENVQSLSSEEFTSDTNDVKVNKNESVNSQGPVHTNEDEIIPVECNSDHSAAPGDDDDVAQESGALKQALINEIKEELHGNDISEHNQQDMIDLADTLKNRYEENSTNSILWPNHTHVFDENRASSISPNFVKSNNMPVIINLNGHETTISNNMQQKVECEENLNTIKHSGIESSTENLSSDLVFEDDEIEYAAPIQSRKPSSHTKQRILSESADDTNNFTQEELDANDYRLRRIDGEEVVEFKYGTLSKKIDVQKAPNDFVNGNTTVTSLRSLRQAYKRPVNTDQFMPSQKTSQKNNVCLDLVKAEDLYPESLSQNYSDQCSNVKETSTENLCLNNSLIQTSGRSSVSSTSTDDTLPLVENIKEEIDISKGSITTNPLDVEPIEAQKSFVQSALLRERASVTAASSSNMQQIKRSSKTSIYDIIKSDITQHKGGINRSTDQNVFELEGSMSTINSPVVLDNMDYLELESKTKKSSRDEVVLPKQHFYFASTIVADDCDNFIQDTKPEHKTPAFLLGPRPWGVHANNAYEIHSSFSKYHENKAALEASIDQNFNYTSATYEKNPAEKDGLSEQQKIKFPQYEKDACNVMKSKSICQMNMNDEMTEQFCSSEAKRSAMQSKSSDVESETARVFANQQNEAYNNSSSNQLQDQYKVLQLKFENWKEQIAENQALLYRRNIVSGKEDEELISISSPSAISSTSLNNTNICLQSKLNQEIDSHATIFNPSTINNEGSQIFNSAAVIPLQSPSQTHSNPQRSPREENKHDSRLHSYTETANPDLKPSCAQLLIAKSKLKQCHTKHHAPTYLGRVIPKPVTTRLSRYSVPSRGIQDAVSTDTLDKVELDKQDCHEFISTRFSNSLKYKNASTPSGQTVNSALRESAPKTQSNAVPRFASKLDEREELMIAIRTAAGKAASPSFNLRQ